MNTRSARAMLCLLLVLLIGAPAVPAAAQTDERFYSQTGYRVDNDAFWQFFQQRGGIKTFGYPVSRQFTLDGFQVQIFQREVMQLQPDGSVSTLNLLDQEVLPYTQINGSTFPAADPALQAAAPSPTDPDYATKIVDFVQANAPDVFEGEPVNFGQTFMTTVTYQDAFPNGDGPQSLVPLFNLQIWGAPTSHPARDPNNANFIYQRFQRGIMHYDKGCGCTQGLLLADYLKSVLTGQNLPSDLRTQATNSRFFLQYDPSQPKSIARPAQLPGSDLTNAFVPSNQTGTAAPSTNQPASGFGYGFQVHSWYLSPQAKNDMAGIVQQAGFNWVKHQIEWQTVEVAPGQYDWRELDAIISTDASKNLNVLLSVAHAPAFYRDAAHGLMPVDNAKFQNLMDAMASRYRGRVAAYELWNEENLSRETGPGNVNPSTYLPLLAAGYHGVKAGDPAAQVFLGALSPTGVTQPGESMDDVEYLRQLYALNGGEVKNYFDALGAHPSGFSNPPDCNPDTPQCSLSGAWNTDPSFFAFYRVGQYHDILVQNGDGGKKIWLTEYGYDSSPVAVPGYEYSTFISEQQQADFLVRAFQIARSTDYIGGLIVWNLNFQMVVDQNDEKWGFGVIRADQSPRPAYTALRNMPKP